MTDMVNLISVALKLQSDAQAEQMRKVRSELAEERKWERAEDRIRRENKE